MALSSPRSPDPNDSALDAIHLKERTRPLRFLVIGAGSRGSGYAATLLSDPTINGHVSAIAEPKASKRNSFWRRYISQGPSPGSEEEPGPGEVFGCWREFLVYEVDRRRRERRGENVIEGVDGIFVCVLDQLHADIITSLAPLHLHMMTEKPLATTLHDCLRVYRSLEPDRAIFSIGHVLRYNPHNILLRELLLENEVIGDILSIEHTEPVGYWHFSHSYVRGNWRKESVGPSLLTKSCHDIDFLLWLLCSQPASSDNPAPAHLPSRVLSLGSLLHFKRSRKPSSAGNATNCLSCPAEPSCLYSAKKIYTDQLANGNARWPVSIVSPEIEDLMDQGKKGTAIETLEAELARDYDSSTPHSEIDGNWFGRCVWEADNSVCDDQIVTMNWDEIPSLKGRGAKNATFHMVASTDKLCEGRGRVYGTKGEIEYDSKVIRVYDFASKHAQTHHPRQSAGAHGGGDVGLVQQFVKGCDAVRTQAMSVAEAQRVHVRCTLEEVLRSYAMVFAAEEARKERKIVEWSEWWTVNVEQALEKMRTGKSDSGVMFLNGDGST